MHLRNAMARLHPVSPYEGFPWDAMPLDLQGWGGTSSVLTAAITALRPTQIIEVGSWKGASAIRMAKLCRELGIDATIACVDTWLGSIEHLLNPQARAEYGTRHGFPTLYEQFLTNVIREGTSDIIVPFPQTSINAAKCLGALGVQADLIYLDASHEEGDVYRDILAYWPLLRPGGVMVGDDYSRNFPGVVIDVARFSEQHGVPMKYIREKWFAEKAAG